ncbi:MAG: phosphate ABC transporter permease PstA [Desulfopila sp.]
MPTLPSSFAITGKVTAGLTRRHRRERYFRRLTVTAVVIALATLLSLFLSIITTGYTAFQQTSIRLDIDLDPAEFTDANIARADFTSLIRKALYTTFPEVTSHQDKERLARLISPGAPHQLMALVTKDPRRIGTSLSVWLPADDDVDMWQKGRYDHTAPESGRHLNDRQLSWLASLASAGRIDRKFNTTFFTNGDSREPEQAGIWGAMCGSLYTLAITLVISFPMGIAAAIYLEEFAPQNIWVDLVTININNLAAVPSIIFGLLGLAIFINSCGLPRATPVTAGLVLTLVTLPTIIITGRAALTAVPASIRQAALAIGASKVQTITHHVLPLAMPTMLTGAIIAMTRALGETAPLLMIGMVAFIVDAPASFTDPATVLPVQIYLWSDNPERAFAEKTAAAIMVLLVCLLLLNGLAVYLRNRFERTSMAGPRCLSHDDT